MTHRSERHPVRVLVSALLCAAAVGAAGSAAADTNDRERAQLMQMQQQLQKLQADNASLQRERTQLQAQAKDAEQLGKEAAQKTREISGAKKDIEKANRRIADLEARIQELQAQSTATIDNWKQALKKSDDALAFSVDVRRRQAEEIKALTARLKLQTARGDSCEIRHVGLYKLSNEILDAYASKHMHWCEPLTGLWQVGEQQKLQELKARLETMTLEETIAPPLEATAAAASDKSAAQTAEPDVKAAEPPASH